MCFKHTSKTLTENFSLEDNIRRTDGGTDGQTDGRTDRKPTPPYVSLPLRGETIIKLDDSAFFRTQSYITEICYFEYLPSLLFGWQKPFSPQFRAIYYLNIITFLAPPRILFSKSAAPIHMKSSPRSKLVSSWESVRTLLRITHLAHRKSYLVIVCPNSHEKRN